MAIGSPPPMRGKVKAVNLLRDKFGITPAYAGKSPLICRIHRKLSDHPRLCGEKFDGSSTICTLPGSPPPMRGKAQLTIRDQPSDRITPAYAGKRNECGSGSSRHGDHPRLCGEKKWKKRKSTLRSGSPPPMRGKVALYGVAGRRGGITPAYAGKRK